MKKSLILAAGLIVLAGGCSSVAPADSNRTVEVVDYRKMQAIETAAERVNVRVIWVRQPTKKVPMEPNA